MRLPRVAIVGRQNVGKSTLLNRLLGAREAISHESPGVTRDRIEVEVTWRGRPFLLVDTGGYVEKAAGIDALVARQAEAAADQADVIVLVVDATTGVTEDDAAMAKRLQRSTKPVLLVANKVDTDRQEPFVPEFYSLGLGEPIGISSIHGRGSGDLLDLILGLLPKEDEPEVEGEDGEAAFALVGRANVGKSSLFNRLVGEERAVVFQEPGTTRDAIDSLVTWEGRPVRFVDTAGFRRLSKRQGLEYYSYVRAVQAIDRSHVVALLVDASEGVTNEDKRIAARVAEAGRGLVVVANKWDLVPSEERAAKFIQIQEDTEVFPRVPVIRTSALSGMGVGKLVPALVAVREEWLRRVSTSQVNQVLQEAQGSHPPPRGGGRLLYGTQVGAGPPKFVIFTSTGELPPTYVRFLQNRLREAFGFNGTPIRISFRPRKKT